MGDATYVRWVIWLAPIGSLGHNRATRRFRAFENAAASVFESFFR